MLADRLQPTRTADDELSGMPITPTFAREALASVPGRRLLRFDAGELCRIAQVLERSRCVPLPGAQIGRLRSIREACARYACLPAPARRAAVALGLIGRTDSQGHFRDHWNLRHWRPVVHQWFDAFAGEVPPVAVAERARHMLIALYVVALDGAAGGAAADRLRADLAQALDRLAEPHRSAVPLAMPPGLDPMRTGSDAQWQTAAVALADDRRGARVKALYFMHALHAALDCRQPDPGRLSRPAYKHLYRDLLEWLRADADSRCCVRATAARLVSGLPWLGPFSAVAPPPATPSVEALPPCFGAYEPRSATIPWALVRALLAAAGCRDALRDEQALAEACAERLIDVLRIDLDAGSGHEARYGWLESCARSRYGASVHWSLFNRLKQGGLVDEARALLGPLEPGDEQACSICGIGT
ncbi:MAG: hypothetical protein AB7F93_09800 [Immundisolibacter sp.]|uniref:hypothetical protein n=1 Tax=Immundisolibacter sp. TaxID=1934948 RepID=UPI003D0A9F14